MILEKRISCICFFFTILLLLCCHVVFAQEHSTHYTVAKGLPNDITYGIFQDHKGYIWIGTDDGLVKFDGNTFKTYTKKDGLLSNFVIDITAYNRETLALATWGGGLHFLRYDSIIPVKADNSSFRLNKVEKIGAHIIAKNEHPNFLKYSFSGKDNASGSTYDFQKNTNSGYKLTELINSNKTSDLSLDFEKVDTVLYCINDPLGQRKSFTGVYTLSEDFELKKVFRFLDESVITAIGNYNDTLFYAASKENLLVFDHHQIIDTIISPFAGKHIKRYIKNEAVEVFVIDAPNAGNEAIITRTIKTGNLLNFSERYRNNALVSELMLDKNQGIWITTYGNGVFHIPLYNTPFHKHYLENSNILDVKQDMSGIHYFLTLFALYTKEQDSFRKVATGKTYNLKFDRRVSEKNHIRIIQYQDARDTVFQMGKISIEIENDTLPDSNSEYSSLLTNYPFKGTKKLHKNNQKVRNIFLVDDKIWIATDSSGIQVYDKDSKNFEYRITIDEGLASNTIRDIFAHHDTIWIATSEGLNRYAQGHIKLYTTNDGLQGNTINSIYVDRHNVLWIGTQKGLSVFKNGAFYNYDTTNGLLSTSVNKIYEDREHQLWIAGNKGVTQIDNAKAYTPEAVPAIAITQHETVFEINTLSFVPGNTIVQYRINDDSWITTAEKSLNFDHFTYDRFTIQFRARKPNSDWTETEYYTFSIKEPWYRKWYSITLFVILTAAVLIFLITRRLKQVVRQNKLLQKTILHSRQLEKKLSEVRENVARDFHDELGNKLAGITATTDIILRDKKIAQTDSSTLVHRVKKDARELYFGIKDFVWSIDAKSDSLEELMDYLTDFGEELYRGKGVAFRTERVISGNGHTLPYYWSRQLLLLFKEAMTNALKHAKSNEVRLYFQCHDNTLKISVTDNGTGFDMKSLKRKNGLHNMKSRADKIGGKISIITTNGTTVCFEGKIA